METIEDWRGRQIQIARSTGGVVAAADPWNNVLQTGVLPWPPPELIQKIYESRQARAFVDFETTLGYYSDLQSLHSEDAITWSFFGPVLYADTATRTRFIEDLLGVIGLPGSSQNARLWLWRRLPHPDTLVPGGPEIDFGIYTDDIFLLGEAKWRSAVGTRQGKSGDKDQLALRREFCQKYGRRLLPGVKRFCVLGVSWTGGMLSHADTEADGVALHLRESTWQALARIDSHPCAEEFQQYLKWKIQHSKPG